MKKIMVNALFCLMLTTTMVPSVIEQKWTTVTGKRDVISLWKYDYSFIVNNRQRKGDKLLKRVQTKNQPRIFIDLFKK